MSRLDRMIAQLRQRPALEVSADVPQSAVALVLVPEPDRMLLIRRAERESDPWSGHLALPGGRRDPKDVDLLQTAIRECREETGVVISRESCVAQLDDLAPRINRVPPLMVRPYVFRMEATSDVVLSGEVAHASWLPLAHLAADGVYLARPLELGGTSRIVEGYQLAEGFLWGLTERIVTPVLEVWRAVG